MKNDKYKAIAFGTLALFMFAPLAQAEVSAGVTGTSDTQMSPVTTSGGYSVTVKTGEDEGAGEGEGSRGSEDGKMVSATNSEKAQIKVTAVKDDGKMEDGAQQEKAQVKEGEGRSESEGSSMGSTTRERERTEIEELNHVQLRMETKDLLSAQEEGTSTEATTTATMGTSTMMIREVKNVHTEADLKNFVRTRAQKDKSIKQVEVADGTVQVTYDEPAKLFGFIGTTIPAHVAVSPEGDVQVSYPWYHIFMKKEVARESIQADIANAIAAQNKATREGMASTTASASTTQATIAAGLGIPNIFEIIANSLKNVTK